MPKVAIRFAESALADLEALRSWYTEQDAPEVGEHLLREIIDSIGALAEHPEMGRMVPEFDQPFLRELVRPPYRIVYRILSDEVIHIITIHHSARGPIGTL